MAKRTKKTQKTTVTLIEVATGIEREFAPTQAAEILSYKKSGGFRLKDGDGVNRNLPVAATKTVSKSDNDCGCA